MKRCAKGPCFCLTRWVGMFLTVSEAAHTGLEPMTDNALLKTPSKGARFIQSIRRPSATAYFILWLLGGLSSFLAFKELGDKLLVRDEVIQNLVAYALLFATVLHQGLIYVDLHQMEVFPAKYVKNFGGWFDTNLEIVIRVLIFVGVLFCAGKFLPGFEIYEQLYATPSVIERIRIGGLTASQFSFVVGSVVLFALNVLWGWLACRRRRPPPRSGASSKLARFFDDPLKVYMLCDSLALTFWLVLVMAIVLGWRSVSQVALFIAVIYIISWVIRFFNVITKEQDADASSQNSQAPPHN